MATLQGHFATERGRRVERRWQLVGIALLGTIVAAALSGVFGRAETVARAIGVYAFLLAVFRVSGRRTLAQVTTFDLVLVLIMGDAAQQALVGTDDAVATAMVSVSTLVMADVGLSAAKHRWPHVDAIVDGLPIPLMSGGQPISARMRAESVSIDDLLTAGRASQDTTRLEDIDTAVLEQDGSISIVPSKPVSPPGRSRATGD